MALRIEAVEGTTIELINSQGGIIYPGKVKILADDRSYAVGTMRDGKSVGIYDHVVGYRGAGAHVSGIEMEPGEEKDGKDEDLRFTALGYLPSDEVELLPLRTM